MTFNSDDHQDCNHTFDPRSEQFLESLRRLLEFEVELWHTTDHYHRQETLYSTSIVDASEFAQSNFEVDGWCVTQVRRMIESEPNLGILKLDESEEFLEMMRRAFEEE